MSSCISIITPCYNSEETLERTIKSVFEQEYENFELILVDDGSQDKTKEIIEKYKSLDGRVKSCYLTHVGVSKARNCGVDEASGEVIAFLDSDDIFYKNSLSERLKTFNEFKGDSSFIGVYCPAKKILLNNKSMGLSESAFKSEAGYALTFGDTFKSPFIPSQLILKRSKFIKIGGFKKESGLCEDYYLWQELMLGGNYFLLNERTSVGYTQRGQSVVHRKPYEHFLAFDEALRDSLEIGQGSSNQVTQSIYEHEISKRAIYTLMLLIALNKEEEVQSLIDFQKGKLPFHLYTPEHLANMFKSACIRVEESNARQWDSIKKKKKSSILLISRMLEDALDTSFQYKKSFENEIYKSSVQLGRVQKALNYFNKLSWTNKVFLFKLGLIYTLAVIIASFFVAYLIRA